MEGRHTSGMLSHRTSGVCLLQQPALPDANRVSLFFTNAFPHVVRQQDYKRQACQKPGRFSYSARRQGLLTSHLGTLSPCRRRQDDIATGPRSTGQTNARCNVPLKTAEQPLWHAESGGVSRPG